MSFDAMYSDEESNSEGEDDDLEGEDDDLDHAVSERSLADDDGDVRTPLELDPTWEGTIKNCLPAIVVLKTASPRGFDVEPAATGEATGSV